MKKNDGEASGQQGNVFIITDQLQSYFQNENWLIVKDILLIGFCYIFYANVEFSVFIKALKYFITILIIRYLISITTTYKNKYTNEKYFQINSHLSLFMILILLSVQNNLFSLGVNQSMAWILILSYGLLIISSQQHYSYDILSTMLLVYYLFTNNYFNHLFINSNTQSSHSTTRSYTE